MLAIDSSVVFSGVQSKYGLDNQKGRQFFDKIIQVPFNVPSYDLSETVKQMVAETINLSNEEIDTSNYLVFIQNSVGNNPRAVKRIFNVYTLLNFIWDIEQADENERLLFFAVICMQMAYGNFYEDLNRFIVNNHYEEAIALLETSDTDRENLAAILNIDDLDDGDSLTFLTFIDTFRKVLCTSESVTKIEIEKLKPLLAQASATTLTDNVQDIKTNVFKNAEQRFNFANHLYKVLLQICNESNRNPDDFRYQQLENGYLIQILNSFRIDINAERMTLDFYMNYMQFEGFITALINPENNSQFVADIVDYENVPANEIAARIINFIETKKGQSFNLTLGKARVSVSFKINAKTKDGSIRFSNIYNGEQLAYVEEIALPAIMDLALKW